MRFELGQIDYLRRLVGVKTSKTSLSSSVQIHTGWRITLQITNNYRKSGSDFHVDNVILGNRWLGVGWGSGSLMQHSWLIRITLDSHFLVTDNLQENDFIKFWNNV